MSNLTVKDLIAILSTLPSDSLVVYVNHNDLTIADNVKEIKGKLCGNYIYHENWEGGDLVNLVCIE
jgi:hypothetical protein